MLLLHRFGKHLGKFSGIIAGLIVAYKKSKNRQLHCSKEGECGLAEFKDGAESKELNKKKYWTGCYFPRLPSSYSSFARTEKTWKEHRLSERYSY